MIVTDTFPVSIILFNVFHTVFPLERPTPILTVEPQSPVFIADKVTLKCEMEHPNGWTYKWQTYDFDYFNNFLSIEHFMSFRNFLRATEFEGNTLNFTEVARFQQATYRCEGWTRSSTMSSHISKPFYLKVNCELIFFHKHDLLHYVYWLRN